jgi:hypothetical protein
MNNAGNKITLYKVSAETASLSRLNKAIASVKTPKELNRVYHSLNSHQLPTTYTGTAAQEH